MNGTAALKCDVRNASGNLVLLCAGRLPPIWISRCPSNTGFFAKSRYEQLKLAYMLVTAEKKWDEEQIAAHQRSH
jgi:hypothetical protein